MNNREKNGLSQPTPHKTCTLDELLERMEGAVKKSPKKGKGVEGK